MSLKEKIKKLPSSPGVYLMKDSLDNVIYVGKSKKLKSRVGSYFTDTKSHSPKVVKMVSNLRDFDYILTDTEFEAFLLESALIKEIKPFYNRLLKNTRAYSYICICTDKENPSIEVTDECSSSNVCFGPYASKNSVEKGLQGIREYFRILCTNPSQKTSTCLNFSLGLCIGICSEDRQKGRYVSILESIINLLKGKDKSIIKTIEQNMNSASERLDFEGAAKYRDYLKAIKYLVNKVKVIEYAKKNRNIVVIERLADDYIKYFLVKENKVLFSEKHFAKHQDYEGLKALMQANISVYFNDKTFADYEIGKEDIDAAQIIYSYLNNKSNSCNYAVIKKEWLRNSSSMKLDAALDKLLSEINKYNSIPPA